jgi:hypothetical protein
MYITDSRPQTNLDSGTQAGRRKWPLQQGRVPAVEDECRHQKVRRNRPRAKSTHRFLVVTIGEGLLVLDPDLTVRFAHRSFGGTFTVTPGDTPRDKEGLQ